MAELNQSSTVPSLASMHWCRPSLYLLPSRTLPLKVSTISTSFSRTMYSCQIQIDHKPKRTQKIVDKLAHESHLSLSCSTTQHKTAQTERRVAAVYDMCGMLLPLKMPTIPRKDNTSVLADCSVPALLGPWQRGNKKGISKQLQRRGQRQPLSATAIR